MARNYACPSDKIVRFVWKRPFIRGNMPVILASSSSRSRSGCCTPFVKVISLWIFIETSTSNGLLQDQYVGCFKDLSQTTRLLITSPPGNKTTVEKCIEECKANGTTFSALQEGNVCLCREDYGSQLPDVTCNLTCSGKTSKDCGGFRHQEVAYVLYTVCPIGSYGAECDKGCRCNREIPCDRITGNCPDGCYGNWSGSACNITSATSNYIGCYKDEPKKSSLEKCIYCDGKGDNNKNNTLESCSQSCAENNYSYAGLQYMWQCFCGDKYDTYDSLNETINCILPCSGDNSIKCGGVSAFNAYSVCPNGSYGRSCAERCHCLNDARCIYRNGSCPSSKCSLGWTGISCNKRDCSKNNGGCYLNETCSNINLNYSNISMCRCSDGFHRSKIWENCTDIDECSIRLCDPESTMCSNTVGSFNCPCKIGFQTHNTTTCLDIDECQQTVCNRSIAECQNIPGSYKCICKEGFGEFNGVNCIAKEQKVGNTGGTVVGALIAVVVVAIALLLIFFLRRRYASCKSSPDESSKSTSASKDLALNSSQGDETATLSCQSKVYDHSRNEPRDKSTANNKGKSTDYVNVNDAVHGERQRSPKDLIALNATSKDTNIYESLNAGVSECDETRLYAELNL